MVKNVQRQLCVEWPDIWHNIEILKDNTTNEARHENDDNKVGLLLCISTTTKQADYYLPKNLPQNIKDKYILVETQPGETLSKDLQEYLKIPKIWNIFEGSKQIILPPKTQSIYDNMKIDPATRESIFFMYALLMSLYLVRMRLFVFVHMKHR